MARVDPTPPNGSSPGRGAAAVAGSGLLTLVVLALAAAVAAAPARLAAQELSAGDAQALLDEFVTYVESRVDDWTDLQLELGRRIDAELERRGDEAPLSGPWDGPDLRKIAAECRADLASASLLAQIGLVARETRDRGLAALAHVDWEATAREFRIWKRREGEAAEVARQVVDLCGEELSLAARRRASDEAFREEHARIWADAEPGPVGEREADLSRRQQAARRAFDRGEEELHRQRAALRARAGALAAPFHVEGDTYRGPIRFLPERAVDGVA
ncbi:MAG TPA: hypothetical protein VIC56_00165 [Gemmatimonadota bacterium]